MLQYWESFVEADGTPNPRFFWDLKTNNLATNLEKTHLKVRL